ncbi:inorganic phosphate transporter [Halobellus limi]|jgi:PiT family inorganic phosphate transporter|uniref:Inorganic phosphate transporter n=1 Tax=Halobellus limi TaxID=699433 RepID=A0A1H5WXR0_9EURY|nr:inorganic phosphate transporter [Halobellus limi]QCC46307.1 inorganic phosphate transporter [Halobellus limi]SEG04274.1 inorganic phosphate transporter, PiT family [Halobellus limi]
MAASALFVLGVAVAIFVGVNIGGSSTGVAFGPATGSDVLSMRLASALMAVFVLLGGITIGRNVVETLGAGFVPPEYFTPGASIGVLLFIGVGILLGNVLKVSTSTSQAAVAAVVGMGAALGVLNWRTVGIVVLWWLLSTILAFWLCAFVGRYLYDAVVDALDLESRDTRLAELAVIAIGCYMAFSAGASNVANAVAPLVGSGQIGMVSGVALGGLAIGAGAFALGPRTMETVGEDITDLSLEASLIAETVAASILTGLSWAGIPASLAVVLTSCVIGLGWGRASRRVPLQAVVRPEGLTDGERSTWGSDQLDLFDPATTKRIVATWIATPTVAGVIAFVAFDVAQRLRLIA